LKLRRGFTLIELIVVMAIVSLLVAMGIPTLNSLLGIEQQSAVKELSQTMTWLQEEAAMRNVAFRMELNVDRGTWKVEVGEPNTLIFSNPEEAEEYRDDLKSKMKRYSSSQQDPEQSNLLENPAQFSPLQDPIFTSEKTLPSGLQIAFVYTPQYGDDGVEPNDEVPEDPEDDNIAHVHIFPDGTAEHTVIRIVNIDDENDGYTLEMEPMGGKINLTNEVVDPEDSLKWLPDEGPPIR
jgi:prepilin-type N-terminal cleavage/methylation domain-containing protein